LIASHHQLSNIKVIIDRNNLQSLDTTENTLALEPLACKWRAFGWSVVECDGHDVERLKDALNQVGPVVVIASTIKGKGVSFMRNSVPWHYKSLSATELETALLEINGQ
jgi:transketolase